MVQFRVFGISIDKKLGRVKSTIAGGFATKEIAEATMKKERFSQLADIVGVEEVPEGESVFVSERLGPAPSTRGMELKRRREELEKITKDIPKGLTTRQRARLKKLTGKELTQKEFVERRTLERLRTGTTKTQFFTFEEREREKERERRRRAERLTAKVEAERGIRATVSIGPSLTEATLDLKPSGAVVGFEARAAEAPFREVTGGLLVKAGTPVKITSDVPLTLLGRPERLDLERTGFFGKLERGIERRITEPLSETAFIKKRREVLTQQRIDVEKEFVTATGFRKGLLGTSLLAFGAEKEVSRTFRDQPLKPLAIAGAGLLFGGVGAAIAGTGAFGAAAVTTTGVVLGTGFAFSVGAEVVAAPTLFTKGEVIGGAAIDVAAFVGGAKVGGRFVGFVKQPRLVDINLATGRIRTITKVDEGFKAREFDISGLTNIFGKKIKQPPTIFEDVTKPGAVLKIGKKPPTTLFRGTDITVKQTLAREGGAFGFVSQELAEGFKRRGGKKEVREFLTTKFVVDPNIRGAVSRPVPTDTGFKTITSIKPEFIALDIVGEKVVTQKPTLKQKATIAATQITTSVLGAEITQPFLTIGATTFLGALDIGVVALVTGSARAVGRFQPAKKQAARISRIERLQKQQRRQEFRGLFEEQRVLKRGKQRIIETQKFQPFIDIRRGPKGRVIETLTRVPKGIERVFFEKGKPLIVKERLGRIEVGQRPEVVGKQLIQLGPKRPKGAKGFVALQVAGVSKIPVGKSAFPKGFGAQIDRPIGDITKLVQVTKGIAVAQRVPSKPKVSKEIQPLIKDIIGEPQLELLKKSPVKELVPKIVEQPKELRRGFRPGVGGKLLQRIQQREAERRLEMELRGEVGVLPGEFGVAKDLGVGVGDKVGEVVGPKKKKKKFALVEEDVFLRGMVPVVSQLPSFNQLPTDIRFPLGDFGVGPARRLRQRRLGGLGDRIGFRQGQIPSLDLGVGIKSSLIVTQALGVGLLSLQQQRQELATKIDVVQQQVPSVVLDVALAQRQIQDIDSRFIQEQIPLEIIIRPPRIPRIPGGPPSPPRGPPIKPPRIPPIFPPGKPPRRIPPRRPPTKKPPRKPPVFPPFIPLPRPRIIKPIEVKPRKEKRRKFRGTPSLSVVLGGMGTKLTRQQIAGKETISPLLIRQIGRQQSIRRIA